MNEMNVMTVVGVVGGRYLVKQGVVQALAKSLVHFKVYDQVLTEIYKFCGPSFNFEFVRDVLAALDNIVNVGEMEAEEKQKLNQVSHARTRSLSPPTCRLSRAGGGRA